MYDRSHGPHRHGPPRECVPEVDNLIPRPRRHRLTRNELSLVEVGSERAAQILEEKSIVAEVNLGMSLRDGCSGKLDVILVTAAQTHVVLLEPMFQARALRPGRLSQKQSLTRLADQSLPEGRIQPVAPALYAGERLAEPVPSLDLVA